MKRKIAIAVLFLAVVAGAVLLLRPADREKPLVLPVPEGYERQKLPVPEETERQEGLPDFEEDKPSNALEPLAIFDCGIRRVQVSVFRNYTEQRQFDTVCLGRRLDFDLLKNHHETADEMGDESYRPDKVPEDFYMDETLCREVYLRPVEDSHSMTAAYYFPSKRGVFQVAFGALVNDHREFDEALAFQREYVEQVRTAAEK